MGYLNEDISYHEDWQSSGLSKSQYTDREFLRINEGMEVAKGFAKDREGHDIDYLSGIHYFFLAKQKIRPAAGKGGLIVPRYAPWDRDFFNTWNWCIAHGWDMVVIKRRRWGFTVKGGGVIPAWLQVTDKGSSYCMTSCDDSRLNMLITDKLKPAISSCFKEDYFDRKTVLSDGERMGFPIKDDPDVMGIIYFLNTSKDKRLASKAAGSSNRGYTLDERFLHPYADLVSYSFDRTLYDGDEKTGTGLHGGSCDTFTDIAVRNLENTIKDSKNPSANIKVMFIPGYADVFSKILGRYLTEDEATQNNLKKRADLRKAAEKGGEMQWIKLQNEIKGNPHTINELIENVESDYFSTAIIHNMNKGTVYSLNHNIKQVNLIENRGVIYPDNNPIKGKISYPEEFNKSVSVIEDPRPDLYTYASGCDPIDFSGANVKGSFFVDLMKNLTTNKYVACLAFKTDDPALGYQLWYNFHYWYRSIRFPNGAPCMMEKNRGASILTSCRAHGTLNLLLHDPFKKTFDSDMDRGWHKSNNPVQFQMMMTYAKNYLEHDIVPWKRFNEGFPKYKPGEEFEKNDICDAFIMSELGSNSLHRGFAIQDDEPKKPKKEIVMMRDNKGFKHQVVVMR